ncbi:MAG: amidohydrolase family protein [Actinomycetia bacterium]|nr:amidohydrolase family protein [Actinomycetes bacterium]
MAQGPASVYIKDAKFMLTVDPQRRLLDGTSLAVSGDRIAAIGPNVELEREWVGPETKIIDGRERFVTPGFINAHIHLESCYDKGLLDDVPVVPWCERYLSYTYGTLTDGSYYYAALVSLLVCLKTGTTTVSDYGTIQTMEGSPVRALTDIGMRGVLARDLMDVHTATKSDSSTTAPAAHATPCSATERSSWRGRRSSGSTRHRRWPRRRSSPSSTSQPPPG